MKEYISAVQWYFGFNKKEAMDYCKNSDINNLIEILKLFNNCAKSSFYND